MQEKTAVVEIYRAYHRPLVVAYKSLGVNESRRVFVYLYTGTDKLRIVRTGKQISVNLVGIMIITSTPRFAA